MKTLTLVAMGTILLAMLFQCCPCAVLQGRLVEPTIQPLVEEPKATPTPTKAPATAKEPSSVGVLAYCDEFGESPVYVQRDQDVIIIWAWLALTPELVQDFIASTTIEVLLDGREVRPDRQSEIVYDTEEGGYVKEWTADVGALPPGSHRVEYHAYWSRQISDGWSTFGPGGEQEEWWSHCEIIVQ